MVPTGLNPYFETNGNGTLCRERNCKWPNQFDRFDPSEESPPGNSRESTLRKEINQLKRVLVDKTLELDFFKGALQKVEVRRQKSGISGEKPSTTKSKK